MADAVLNVGLVGYKFMGKAHSNAWLQVPHYFETPLRPVMHTICGRDEGGVRAMAQRWGWKNAVTDFRDLCANPEIGLVDVAVPNNAHPEVVIAAAEAGKAVACEKPLARSLKEARPMVAAVKKAQVPNFVWFNYRRVPALAFARQLIEAGRIGKVFHVRAQYLQDWIKDPNMPLTWRVSKSGTGTGALGDLAAHCVDLCRFLTGDEFKEVCGILNTFVKQRPVGQMVGGLSASTASGPKKMGKVDVDDATAFLVHFRSGAMGVFEATRFATGHHNNNCVEINGDKGAIRFSFPNFSTLEFFDDTLPRSEKGWRKISVTVGQDPYSGKYWPADHVIGYAETFVNTAADMLEHLAGKTKTFHANFEDGLRTQEILEAVGISSVEKRWVSIQELQ